MNAPTISKKGLYMSVFCFHALEPWVFLKVGRPAVSAGSPLRDPALGSIRSNRFKVKGMEMICKQEAIIYLFQKQPDLVQVLSHEPLQYRSRFSRPTTSKTIDRIRTPVGQICTLMQPQPFNWRPNVTWYIN
jgi:hypothetical protein